MLSIFGWSMVSWQWDLTMPLLGESFFHQMGSHHGTSPSTRSNHTSLYRPLMGRVEERNRHRKTAKSITTQTIRDHPTSTVVMPRCLGCRSTSLYLHVRIRSPSLRLLPLRITHCFSDHREDVKDHRLVLYLLRSVHTVGCHPPSYQTSMVSLPEFDLEPALGDALGYRGEQSTHHT